MSAPEHNPYIVDLAEEFDNVEFGAVTHKQVEIFDDIRNHHKSRTYHLDGKSESNILFVTSFEWKTAYMQSPHNTLIPYTIESSTNYYFANDGKHWYVSKNPFADNSMPNMYNHVYEVEKVLAWKLEQLPRKFEEDKDKHTQTMWVSLRVTVNKDYYDKETEQSNPPDPIDMLIPYMQYQEFKRYWKRMKRKFYNKLSKGAKKTPFDQTFNDLT